MSQVAHHEDHGEETFSDTIMSALDDMLKALAAVDTSEKQACGAKILDSLRIEETGAVLKVSVETAVEAGDCPRLGG